MKEYADALESLNDNNVSLGGAMNSGKTLTSTAAAPGTGRNPDQATGAIPAVTSGDSPVIVATGAMNSGKVK